MAPNAATASVVASLFFVSYSLPKGLPLFVVVAAERELLLLLLGCFNKRSQSARWGRLSMYTLQVVCVCVYGCA